jgi:hypothetical protein
MSKILTVTVDEEAGMLRSVKDIYQLVEAKAERRGCLLQTGVRMSGIKYTLNFRNRSDGVQLTVC